MCQFRHTGVLTILKLPAQNGLFRPKNSQVGFDAKSRVRYPLSPRTAYISPTYRLHYLAIWPILILTAPLQPPTRRITSGKPFSAFQGPSKPPTRRITLAPHLPRIPGPSKPPTRRITHESAGESAPRSSKPPTRRITATECLTHCRKPSKPPTRRIT